MQLQCDPPLLLVRDDLEAGGIDRVVDWYTASIAGETKSWLAKTLKHAWATKTNQYSIPWDVRQITEHMSASMLAEVRRDTQLVYGAEKYISELPETYRFQLNIYLDLCSHRPSPHSSPDPSETSRVLRINDKILEAVGGSLLLLANEYCIALQSKHWAEGEPQAVSAHIKFLVAVANDAHRLG